MTEHLDKLQKLRIFLRENGLRRLDLLGAFNAEMQVYMGENESCQGWTVNAIQYRENGHPDATSIDVHVYPFDMEFHTKFLHEELSVTDKKEIN